MAVSTSEIRHVSEEEYPMWTKKRHAERWRRGAYYEATLHRYAIIPDDFMDASADSVPGCAPTHKVRQ